jgi:hypothetical protein
VKLVLYPSFHDTETERGRLGMARWFTFWVLCFDRCARIAICQRELASQTMETLIPSSGQETCTSVVYSVATSCEKDIAAPVLSVLTALQLMLQGGGSGIVSASAIIMCFDTTSQPIDMSSLRKKKQGNDEGISPPVDLPPESFSAMCMSSRMEWPRDDVDCSISRFLPLLVEVVAAPLISTKTFRSDPKAPPTIRASKVAFDNMLPSESPRLCAFRSHREH